MTEAASAINDVIRQPQMTSTCIQTDLTVPPNTPSSTNSNITSFDFPDPPQESSTTISSSSEDEENTRSPMASAASRPANKKRRRPPSFKKHRVAPKKTISEADDEDSDIDKEKQETELKLKLELLSETQQSKENKHRSSSSKTNSTEENSSDSEDDDEIDDVKKWQKFGQELRMIADSFGPPGFDDGSNDDPNAVNPFQVTDLLGFINLMLPISVPQSLWSALLSYAAWKIFKKFQ